MTLSRRSRASRKESRTRCFISPSHRPEKKYDAVLLGRTVSFGARGMSDYTLHKDPHRKERYIKRHSKHERWSDPLTAGFWSRWLLWNRGSLRASATDIQRRFGIYVSFSPGQKKSTRRNR
jgi:hypothetical protein